MQRLQAILVYFVALIALVNAGNKDLCNPGSDSECVRYGSNMCCAHIIYEFRGDTQDFHACASRAGIEFTNGNIFDQYGFDGRWYCDFAINGVSASLVIIASLASVLSF